MTAFILGLLVYVIALGGILVVYAWLRRASTLQARLFAAGIILRIVAGVALFAVSKFELPLLTAHQSGNGFWNFAIDARTYFDQASLAATNGLSSISNTAASPMYLRVLAAWMKLVGVTPLSAVSLNVVCYLLLVTLIGSAARGSRMGSFAIATVSFSPALLIFGTQALKDVFSVLLIGLALAGVRLWTLGVSSNRAQQLVLSSGGAGMLALAVYLMSGVRAYFGVLLIAAFLASAAAALVSTSSRWRVGARYAFAVPVLWAAFFAGAGPYYSHYESVLRTAIGRPGAPIAVLDETRTAFVATGGATATVPMDPPNSGATRVDPPPVTALGDPPQSIGANSDDADRVKSALFGLGTIFIPISILKATSLITFTGGRGLLFITDLDTVMIDVTLLIAAYLLLTSRSTLSPPVTVFTVVLFAITAVSMAYVVTNYGTLFRLRLLAVAPLWMLPAFAQASEYAPRRAASIQL